MSGDAFEQAFERVLKREGGYIDHPADRGAATNLGVTQRTYTMWRSRRGLGYQDVRLLGRGEARLIYRDNYWEPARCPLLPAAVQELHFDAAVNHGTRRAAVLLQEAVRVDADGVIGPQTLAACQDMPPDLLRARYLCARYRFYGQIVARDRSQLAFIAGWMNRMAEFNH